MDSVLVDQRKNFYKKELSEPLDERYLYDLGKIAVKPANHTKSVCVSLTRTDIWIMYDHGRMVSDKL